MQFVEVVQHRRITFINSPFIASVVWTPPDLLSLVYCPVSGDWIFITGNITAYKGMGNAILLKFCASQFLSS